MARTDRPTDASDIDCTYDVAIVGYGPTGAVLANLLGQAGIRTAVFERAADVYALPRAAHFDGETLRVFQTLGLAQTVMAFSRPGNKGMHFESASGQTLLVRSASDRPGPHGYANNWYFHQPDLERALRDGVARYSSVAVHLLHEVVAVFQTDTTARLEIRDLENRREFTVSARYVIGCDGASSTVRRALGGETLDLGLHQPWLCLDLLMRREVDLPEYTLQLCDPARPMTLVNMAGRRRRWEIMLMPGDDPGAVAGPAAVWPLLARWLTPDDADIERAAVYTFHSLIATRWRNRRLLIAGDAAHQTPPFLGQGLCAGIRDAANLGWKLIRTLRFGADSPIADALLDSYASERLPHVRAFIELAVRVGGVVQTTDPELAAERDRRFAETGPEVFAFPVPHLGPGIHTGADPTVASIFPQPCLDDGRLLDEALGYEFALLIAPGHLRLIDDTARARMAKAGVLIIDAPGGAVIDWLSARRLGAVLLRPDRYVLGVAETAADFDRLAKVLCHAEQ